MQFINFPFEIIVDICLYIDVYSLNALALSCKDLTFVLKHPPLWRHIRFINFEEQYQIEKQFLNQSFPPKLTTFKIPYKLSRIDDRRARQLLTMLRKNNLSSVVCSINFDFTSINCTSIWESINGFLNLEEISCRGCSNLSLRDLGTALTWFEPLEPVLKLKKLHVLWCKDMSPRAIIRQRLNLNVGDVSYYYRTVLIGFLKALKQLKTEKPIQLDVDTCKTCRTNITITIPCSSCKILKNFCVSCDMDRGCSDCFRFYCGTGSCKPHPDPFLISGKIVDGRRITSCNICYGGS
ncbi:9197_t:CDS:2 [Scutellospora calospora]|uniref:9197_t:CDS:1 n=1 Tax=Scutellospora calospora TaxID=85575 RepID=A0ACA9K6H5_9GLOM|nr:9197_t:CDS:2 [Scutellospora calospora]